MKAKNNDVSGQVLRERNVGDEREEKDARNWRKESDRFLCGRENVMCLCWMASAAMTAVVQWKACSRCRWTFTLLYLFGCACERGRKHEASERGRFVDGCCAAHLHRRNAGLPSADRHRRTFFF
jgi:hypothetical protein